MIKCTARYRAKGSNPFNPYWQAAARNIRTITVDLTPAQVKIKDELAKEATPKGFEFISVEEQK